jgi:hypothetical protein
MLFSMPNVGCTHKRQSLLDLVHSELSLRRLSKQERLALGAICLCTLLLLAALQYGRVFSGDEIGTLRYLQKSSTYILTHFSTWLSMNYFILVERWLSHLFGAMDWRLTLLPIAAAIAIIPLTASIALKFTGSTRTALIAAGLAAFNPYLVYWGPAIRAYSLLVAFSLLVISEFFVGIGNPTGGAACDARQPPYCCYLCTSTAFTQSHSSSYYWSLKAFQLVSPALEDFSGDPGLFGFLWLEWP